MSIGCSSTYIERIAPTESAFFSGNYESAIPKIRSLVNDSNSGDRLLYLMEAGVVFHTQGDYKKSLTVFQEAEQLADIAERTVTQKGLAFALNDTHLDFAGENFERVLIKFYMSLNYLLLSDFENAKRYFKKVEYELKEMKFTESSYKQNLFIRYLDAIVSENVGKFNDARVQYKNLEQIAPNLKEITGDRLILAMKEKDIKDIQRYSNGLEYVQSFNKELKKIPYSLDMGELIIINQAGKAAVKESRGKILEDGVFGSYLKSSIASTLTSQTSSRAMTVGAILALVGAAENPVPIYKERDVESSGQSEIIINGVSVQKTKILNSYSETAMKNFNDNYETIVQKNIVSIATKIIIAAGAAMAAREIAAASSGKGDGAQLIADIVEMIVGSAVGAGISATIAPDLRCWRLLPSNFQVSRIFLEPGTYNVQLKPAGTKVIPKNEFQNIVVEKGKITFINVRSF